MQRTYNDKLGAAENTVAFVQDGVEVVAGGDRVGLLLDPCFAWVLLDAAARDFNAMAVAFGAGPELKHKYSLRAIEAARLRALVPPPTFAAIVNADATGSDVEAEQNKNTPIAADDEDDLIG
jgi:hypothetical protein